MSSQEKKTDGDKSFDASVNDVKKVLLESGIEVKPLYTREDMQDSEADQSIPGQYPFTRGIHSEMYRKRPFTIR